MVGARPRGAARAGRRGPQRRADRPGFVHDHFSAFYPLGTASPVIRSLEPRGPRPPLVTRAARARAPHARRPLRGPVADLDETAASLDAYVARRRRRRGAASTRLWKKTEGRVVDALLSPCSPTRATLQLTAATGPLGTASRSPGSGCRRPTRWRERSGAGRPAAPRREPPAHRPHDPLGHRRDLRVAAHEPRSGARLPGPGGRVGEPHRCARPPARGAAARSGAARGSRTSTCAADAPSA